MKQDKNHKCNKLKGKIIINVTLIRFEGTGKTFPLNFILQFSIIISDFKMRNYLALIYKKKKPSGHMSSK